MADRPSTQLPLTDRVRAQRDAHKLRHPIVRAAFVVAGMTVTLAGLAMLVLPGPALLVIPIGLGLLALEFTAAEKLLEKAERAALAAQAKATNTSPRQRLLGVLAAVSLAAAAVAAALVWDAPVLPV
ncbi:MAG: putative transrane protein [bacterium]|jgi:uncharacterized protein (TIGR02611 family)